MSDAALDRMIRADEANRTENNSLLALSAAERQAMYRSPNPAAYLDKGKNKGPEYLDIRNPVFRERMRTTASSSLGNDLYDVADPLTYLTTTHPEEVLPHTESERLLAKEYTKAKILDTAQRIVLEDGAATDVQQHVDMNLSSAETQRAARVCRDNELDNQYRARLYELAKAQAAASTNNNTSALTTTASAGAGGQLESELPGPYLSFETNGRFTRYEAITRRPPAHRTAASILARSTSVGKDRQRSRHYPAARRAPSPAQGGAAAGAAATAEGHEPQQQQRSSLHKWQHSMGYYPSEEPGVNEE